MSYETSRISIGQCDCLESASVPLDLFSSISTHRSTQNTLINLVSKNTHESYITIQSSFSNLARNLFRLQEIPNHYSGQPIFDLDFPCLKEIAPTKSSCFMVCFAGRFMATVHRQSLLLKSIPTLLFSLIHEKNETQARGANPGSSLYDH